MEETVENKVVSRIYGFAALGTREAIDSSLHRLQKKGSWNEFVEAVHEPQTDRTVCVESGGHVFCFRHISLAKTDSNRRS